MLWGNPARAVFPAAAKSLSSAVFPACQYFQPVRARIPKRSFPRSAKVSYGAAFGFPRSAFPLGLALDPSEPTDQRSEFPQAPSRAGCYFQGPLSPHHLFPRGKARSPEKSFLSEWKSKSASDIGISLALESAASKSLVRTLKYKYDTELFSL